MANPLTSGSKRKTLVADIHSAPQTEIINSLIAKTKTALGNTEKGLITSYLLAVDIVDNEALRNFETGANKFSQNILRS